MLYQASSKTFAMDALHLLPKILIARDFHPRQTRAGFTGRPVQKFSYFKIFDAIYSIQPIKCSIQPMKRELHRQGRRLGGTEPWETSEGGRACQLAHHNLRIQENVNRKRQNSGIRGSIASKTARQSRNRVERIERIEIGKDRKLKGI